MPVVRHPCIRSQRCVQATAAHLRQANDLLPAVGIDVGRYPQGIDNFDPNGFANFKNLLGDGSDFGIELCAEPSPDGLAQAFIIGEDFVGDDSVCLILGDNIFYGHGFSEMLRRRCLDQKARLSLATMWLILSVSV